MAKKRKGLTDDVSLDVKLQTGAVVSLKVKNLRTGAIKLLSFSIRDLFDTEESVEVPDDMQNDLPATKESECKEKKESESKFVGTEIENYEDDSTEIVQDDRNNEEEDEESND